MLLQVRSFIWPFFEFTSMISTSPSNFDFNDPCASTTSPSLMIRLIRDLFPLSRSVTGNGLRSTLSRIRCEIPLTIREVPSGTRVLDWEIPREWNIREGWIETLDGRRVVDLSASNLYVMSYSGPVDRVVSREELAAHVHTLPNQPNLIPYRKSYFGDGWAFCLPDATWMSMQDESYRVRIDSDFSAGSLSYGELLIPGSEPDEFVISAHCCHPSLANDNLSGIAVATALARTLLTRKTRLSYRFLFIPATFGSLAWLAQNESVLPRIQHGLVLSCVGDSGPFHYKQSRRGATQIDRAVARVLAERNESFSILPFRPDGCDERQFCSPAYNLPFGCFMRSPNGTFPQYHTSADNLDFVKEDALRGSLAVLLQVLDLLEENVTYVRRDGRGEPFLGRHGLYQALTGGERAEETMQLAVQWVLNLADGENDILDIADRSGLSHTQLVAAARAAREVDLICAIN
jgi:aminopeptidase-like protein